MRTKKICSHLMSLRSEVALDPVSHPGDGGAEEMDTWQGPISIADMKLTRRGTLQDTSLKVRWMKDLAEELDPADPMLAPHMPSVLQAALTNIQQHSFEGRDLKSARFAAAVLESALRTCKT